MARLRLLSQDLLANHVDSSDNSCRILLTRLCRVRNGSRRLCKVIIPFQHDLAITTNEVRMFLDKGRAISELRSPNRDDGPIARILWKTAVVLDSDPYNSYANEATELRQKAEVAKAELLAGGEGGIIPFREEGDPSKRTEEEDSYDSLIPLFFR
jgi:hypothetical protein